MTPSREREAIDAMLGDAEAFKAWQANCRRRGELSRIIEWAKVNPSRYSMACLRLLWIDSWRAGDMREIFDAYCRTRAKVFARHTLAWGRHIEMTKGGCFYTSGFDRDGCAYLKIKYASPDYNIHLGAIVFDDGNNALDESVIHPRMVNIPMSGPP